MNQEIFDRTQEIFDINGAYHEAGHAVVAYHQKWWVRYVEIEGVGIGQHDYAAIRYDVFDETASRITTFCCAGHLAAWKKDQLGDKFLSDEQLLNDIEGIHYGYYEADSDVNDTDKSLLAIMRENPEWSDGQVIAEFRVWESDCWEMLEDKELWSDIEKVATALLAKGRLEREEVEALLESVTFG